MRARATVLAVLLALAAGLFGLTRSRANDTAVTPDGMALARGVDFTSQIQPILSARCMPCHFPGGSMHERLPFDQPQTITKLGERLFTRIHDANEQKLIREFLAQQ